VIDCQTRNLTGDIAVRKTWERFAFTDHLYRVLACVRLARTARRGGLGIDDSEATVPQQRRWVVKRVVKFLPQAPRCRCLRLVVGIKIASRPWSFVQTYFLSAGKTLASDHVNHTASKGLNP
jgi:hypothetical protein